MQRLIYLRNFIRNLIFIGFLITLICSLSWALTNNVSVTSATKLIQRAEQERWFEEQQWLRLGQYKKQWFGGYRSATDSEKFFLHPEGETRPDLELLATLQSLLDNTRLIQSRDGRFSEPVACVFPARKIWLEKKIGFLLPSPDCERFERFREVLQPQSLTYVFSSYYLNNPASAFGHTFLRINKSPASQDGQRYELADYGVGYAAVQISDNPLVYSFLGVSGLMPGAFDINPYYFKVREYNDFESRDLWEYDLNLSSDEVEMVVATIWELIDINFNYHYFSENCSYRILSILETAKPSLDLTSQLKSQVMPADTVQTLNENPSLISRISYRPSVRATFEHRYKSLTEEEQNRLRKFSRNERLTELTEGLPEVSKKNVLDTAIDYLDYRYPKEILRKEGKYSFKKEVLAERASLKITSDFLTVPPPLVEAPHEAHGSRRWGLGQRERNNQSSFLFEAKLSLHDLLDPKYGYPPTAQITMGHLGLSWAEQTNELTLDKFIVYEVISLAPLDDFKDASSWRLKFAIERGYESNCSGQCRWIELSGGSGLTKTFWSNLEASFWMRLTTQSSPDFIDKNWNIGAGPGASLRWNIDRWALFADLFYRLDYQAVVNENRHYKVGINWSFNKSLGLRLNAESMNSIQGADLLAFYYY